MWPKKTKHPTSCAPTRHRMHQFDVEFNRQEVVFHVDQAFPSETAAQAVLRGQCVSITGEALAKAQLVCNHAAPDEVFFYYLASREHPFLIDDIFVPIQQVSVGACKVDGSWVLRAGREVRAMGKQIVAAGHSHGNGCVFVSYTDQAQMLQLAQEGVGYACVRLASIPGTAVPGGGGPNTPQASGEEQFEVTFGDSDVKVRIACPQGAVAAEDLKVTLAHPEHRIISIFATANAQGMHLFPACEKTVCGMCGAVRERLIDPSDITVHVLGPVALNQAQQRALTQDVSRKVLRTAAVLSEGVSATRDSETDDSLAGNTHTLSADGAGPAGSTLPGAAPYEVYRHGKLLCKIRAAVVEEAASTCPSLALALGWRSNDEHANSGGDHA